MNVTVKVESVVNTGPNDIACGISDDLSAIISQKSMGMAV
tara:strand:+ start:1933 stop:2052 length:120 start_codon:yes stop_codon:yes gene_type:complete